MPFFVIFLIYPVAWAQGSSQLRLVLVLSTPSYFLPLSSSRHRVLLSRDSLIISPLSLYVSIYLYLFPPVYIYRYVH